MAVLGDCCHVLAADADGAKVSGYWLLLYCDSCVRRRRHHHRALLEHRHRHDDRRRGKGEVPKSRDGGGRPRLHLLGYGPCADLRRSVHQCFRGRTECAESIL